MKKLVSTLNLDKKEWLKLYLPARSAVVLKKVKE